MRLVLFIVVPIIVFAAAGVGAYLGLRGHGGVNTVHADRVVTVVPESLPHPEIFSDPQQSVLDSSGALQADARYVVMVMALQLSLERFHGSTGRFPASLSELFPDFAPLDEQGAPLQAVLSNASGAPFSYSSDQASDSYTLSAVLSNGKTYTVHSPGDGSQ